MYVRHNEDALKNKIDNLNDFRNFYKDITFPCIVHLTKERCKNFGDRTPGHNIMLYAFGVKLQKTGMDLDPLGRRNQWKLKWLRNGPGLPYIKMLFTVLLRGLLTQVVPPQLFSQHPCYLLCINFSLIMAHRFPSLISWRMFTSCLPHEVVP